MPFKALTAIGHIVIPAQAGIQKRNHGIRKREKGLQRGANNLIMTFGRLKTEWIRDSIYRNPSEAKDSVFEYIELFYNRQRRHVRKAMSSRQTLRRAAHCNNRKLFTNASIVRFG